MIVKPSYEIEASDFTEKKKNIVQNGGFEYADDALDPQANPTDGDMSLFTDWFVERSGTSAPQITFRTEAVTIDSSSAQSAEMEITVAGSGTPVAGLYQLVYNFAEFQSKKVSFRLRGHCSNASKMRSYIDDGVTKTYSSYHTGGGSFESLDVEDFDVNAAATKLEVGFEVVADDTFTVYADNAMLEVGDTSMSMTPYDVIKNPIVICKAMLSTELNNIPTGTWTQLPFDTKVYDIGNNFDTANYDFVVPFDGYYWIECRILWYTLVADRRHILRIMKNDATSLDVDWRNIGGTGNPASNKAGTIEHLAKDETVQAYARHDTAVNEDIYDEVYYTWFQVVLIQKG